MSVTNILTGTIIGTDDKNKVIENMRKNNSKQDELTKLALEEAVKVANSKQFGNTKELENFLNQESQNNIKKYDPISIMADLEEAEDDEDKIISPNMDADFQKLVPTQKKATTAKYNDITSINDYIDLAKTRSESLEKQMKSQKKILANLKTQQEKCKKTYQNVNQKLQKTNQAFITELQKCKTTSAILDNARTENNPTAITKAQEQLKKDIVVAYKMKQQRDNLSTQLNAVQKAYTIATHAHNNTLREYNSNEYNKNLADKLVKQYGDIAGHLKEQRNKILKQASEETKDLISAMDSVGKQMNPEVRSQTFQTHLFIETQKIYDYYLNLRKEYNTIKKQAKQNDYNRKQQLVELRKITDQIIANKQQRELLARQEQNMSNNIEQTTGEDKDKQKQRLKEQYKTLSEEKSLLEDKQANLKYELYEKEIDEKLLQPEEELQKFLDAPIEQKKQQIETKKREEKKNE